MVVKSRCFRETLRVLQCQQLILYLPSGRRHIHSIASIKVTGSNATLSGCASEEDLYTYKAQRWIWNESQHLRRRYVKFDLKQLAKIAETAAGENAVCINVTKLPEGNFNKVFLARMKDGRELIVKIPNPNSGLPHYTTASEVATIDYLQSNLGISVPRVLSYCSRVSESKLGAEYIIMEKAPGIELSRVWDDLQPRDKVPLVKELADITAKLSKIRFPFYGSLYHQKDLSKSEAKPIERGFAIGPTTARSWFDDGREVAEAHVWESASEVMNALAQRETACVRRFPAFPSDCQQGIFNGPGGYQPTHKLKLAVLHDFESIYRYILPSRGSLNAGILWHNDLHSENIFVDAADPKRISSIIDWQATPIYPVFLVSRHPSLVDFDGPKPEGYTQPVLPSNIKEMTQKSKQAAKDLFLAQSLWLLYETQVQKQSPDLLHAFRFAGTHQSQLLDAIGSIFDDGEPYIQSLITAITEKEAWRKVVGTDENGNSRVPCPLNYTKEEVTQQRAIFTKWEKDIDRKQQVITEIGAYTGWNGAVSPNEYDEMMGRLEAAKKRFLDRESRTVEERDAWERVWPFQDAESSEKDKGHPKCTE